MTTVTKQSLACPSCNKSEFLRANVMQDVDVTVDEARHMENGFGFSSPEVDDSGELYCSHCGSHLALHFEAGTHRLLLDE